MAVSLYIRDRSPSTLYSKYSMRTDNIELFTIKAQSLLAAPFTSFLPCAVPTVNTIKLTSSLVLWKIYFLIKFLPTIKPSLLGTSTLTRWNTMIIHQKNNLLSMMQSCNNFPHTSRHTQFPNDNSTASASLLDHIWTKLLSFPLLAVFFLP